MPSLVGNKPNQVPSNGDLGTLAFQDSNAVNITGGMVDVSAGTAALPTLGTTGDPNTGVFFPAADTVAVATNGAEAVRVDASGNLGLGLTPSAWGANYKVIEANGNAAALFAASTVNGVQLSSNTFHNGTSWTYKTTGEASRYAVNTGQHVWFSAVSGTANTAITWLERMRIDSAGNVGIGTAAPNNRLQVQAGNFANVAAAITQGSGTTGNASQLLLQDGSFTLGALTAYGTAYGSSLSSAAMMSSNTVITTGSAANYSSSNFATRYIQANGTHQWWNAPSGTAGNPITFTQAMTLHASGGLSIGNTTDPTAGVLSITTASKTNSLILTDTGTFGANLKLTGDGATTPTKTIRVNGGQFQIVNSAYSAVPLSLTDSGNLTVTGKIKTAGYTVATLPAGVVGDRAYVTDATAPTYLGALTGGGAVTCPVFFNGTTWVSA